MIDLAQASEDRRYMAEALRLASATWPSPNPRVGAIAVKDGQVVGRGRHLQTGGPHAEVFALAEAAEKARGATLYVTLEPCCHVGRTPPCTRAILSAGVSRVVVGCKDANPVVSGQGLSQLRDAGVAVTEGVRAEEAQRLIAGHSRYMQTHLPFVTWKYAMSLDGKIATASGESRWISGEESRREVHRMRRSADAVLVGVSTVLADDPELTVRHVRPAHHPMRVVFDSRGRLPSASKLLNSPGGPVIVFVSKQCELEDRQRIRSCGAEVIESGEERVDVEDALRMLAADYDIREMLLESGPALARALLDAQLINEVVCFVSGKLIGGQSAPGPLGGESATPLALVPTAQILRTRRFGGDVALYASIPESQTSG